MSDLLTVPRPDDTTADEQATKSRKRQWGAERRSEPLAIVHPEPSRRKIIWGRIGIVVTVLAWAAYVVTTVLRALINDPTAGFRFRAEAVSYVVVVTFLTFSALMYLLARQGALNRFREHRRVPRGELDRHFADYKDAVTVLVPSYAEEPQVVRATLWSAALQEFPDLSVVLLLDDPPSPTDPDDQERLQATRDLAASITRTLKEPSERLNAASDAFNRRSGEGKAGGELPALIEEYEYAAGWLEGMAEAERVEDHVDEFFVDLVLMGLARELRLVLTALYAAKAQGAEPEPARMRELYARLTWIFNARVSTFERKKYASLSHEANKAMNLNSYIGLMGHRWQKVETADGTVLRPADEPAADDLVIGQHLLLPSTPTPCCCGTTACDWSTSSSAAATNGSPSPRRRTPPTAARRRASSGSPAPPPISSTSCIRG